MSGKIFDIIKFRGDNNLECEIAILCAHVFSGEKKKKEWTGTLARHRHRWEDTKLRFKEIGFIDIHDLADPGVKPEIFELRKMKEVS